MLVLNLFVFLCAQRLYRIYSNLSTRVYQKMVRTIPGFDKVMEKVQADANARYERRKARRVAEKQAELEKAFGGIRTDP